MQQNIKGKQKPLLISEEHAGRLLQISRKAKWLFPSSLGRPIAKNIPEWLDSIIISQSLLPEAVKYFFEKGQIDEAYELIANVWRLWVLGHKEKEGRIFLSTILDKKNFPETLYCALTLYGDGLFAYRPGDTASSRECNNCKAPLHFSKGDFVNVPVAIARFPFEDTFPPQKYVERSFNVQRWTEMPVGGHFATLEQPELLTKDIKDFFIDLNKSQ